jgi:hypothetical protein
VNPARTFAAGLNAEANLDVHSELERWLRVLAEVERLRRLLAGRERAPLSSTTSIPM